MSKLGFSPLKRYSGSIKSSDDRVRSICLECSVGCGLWAYRAGGVIVDIQGDEDHPVSRGRLCARGIAFVQGINHPERLSHIGNRQGQGESFQLSDNWEKAMDAVAEHLRRIQGRYGAKSLLIACAPAAGLDFYLGALRFAELWGTPYVFHPVYSARWPKLTHNPQFQVQPCYDWGRSHCIFLCEADLATSHPVAFQWVLEAQDKGAQVVCLDSRFTTSMSKANKGFIIKPESGNRLGLALVKILLSENACNVAHLEEAFGEVGPWRDSFDSLELDRLDEITGLSVEKVTELARLLARQRPVTLITGRKLELRPNHRIWSTLAEAMGWSAEPGGGWYPLDFPVLPVNPALDLQTSKKPAGRAPDTKESEEEGPEESEEFALEPGHPIKAVICCGDSFYEFLSPLRPALEKAEQAIYFGTFPTRTWNQVHWFFPAQVWAEQNHLSFSNDRAMQWGGRLVEPREGCRSGLAFWSSLAQRFGDVEHLDWKKFFPWVKEDGRADHQSFYNWLLDLSPLTHGRQVEEIIAATPSLSFWPVPEGTPTGKTAPWKAPAVLPTEPVLEEEPLPLYYQFGQVVIRSTEASAWWPWLKDLEDLEAVQLNPATAAVLGVENGEEIVVSNHNGGFIGHARLTRMVPRWLVWSPHRLETNRVVVHKKDQDMAAAAEILKEFLS
jgi:anaerobic selenocysteine-containing dehydrogenase